MMPWEMSWLSTYLPINHAEIKKNKNLPNISKVLIMDSGSGTLDFAATVRNFKPLFKMISKLGAYIKTKATDLEIYKHCCRAHFWHCWRNLTDSNHEETWQFQTKKFVSVSFFISYLFSNYYLAVTSQNRAD